MDAGPQIVFGLMAPLLSVDLELLYVDLDEADMDAGTQIVFDS